MKRALLAGLAISTLVTLANAPVAVAATHVAFNFGGVSMGFSDGYWDNHHRWHTWRRGEAARYRAEHADHYSAWRHNDPHHR